MSSSSFLAVAAASWGLLMSVAPILQIRTIRRARSSAGVSSGYLMILLVGFVLWLAYGLAIGNVALIVPNSVAFAVCAVTLVTVRRYRPQPAIAATTSSS